MYEILLSVQWYILTSQFSGHDTDFKRAILNLHSSYWKQALIQKLQQLFLSVDILAVNSLMLYLPRSLEHNIFY